MRVHLCLLGVLISAAVLPAQQTAVPTPSDVPVFRTSTDLATIDAIVTDGDGKHVTDLTREDFEVTVAGRRQTLDQALYVRTQDQPRVLAAARAAAGQGASGVADGSQARGGSRASQTLRTTGTSPEGVARTIALAVDDLGLSFESMYYVRNAVHKYIDTQIEPGDLAAIIRTAGGIGALQQFTADKRLLHMAADRLVWDFRSRSGIGAFVANNGNVPTGLGFDDADAFRGSLASVGSMAALDFIARGVAPLPGRKCIVYFSEGFQSIFRDRMGIGTNGSGRIWAAMSRMLDHANASGVVIYTIDARGLQTGGLNAEDNPIIRDWNGPRGESSMNGPESGGFLDVPGHRMGAAAEASEDRGRVLIDSQESLKFIADQTGGLAIENTNDLNLGIRRVLDDQQGYYLLGYVAPKGAPRSGWDQGRVKVRVKRPGLRVRARQGFFGPSDPGQSRKPESADPLVMSAISPFGAGAITVRLTSLFGHDVATGPYVRSLVFVDPGDLHFAVDDAGQHTARFQVLLMAIGDNGQVLDGRRREVSLALSDQNFRLVQERGVVVALKTLAKEPGPYQMRAAVEDLTSKTVGSASQFLEVPAVGRGRLALSGVLLKGDAESTPIQGEPNRDTASGLADAVLFETEVRVLLPGVEAVYAYEIYDGLKDADPKLEMAAAVIRDGKVVYQSPFTPVTASPKVDGKMRAIPIAGKLALGGDMPAGRYTLEVIVRGPKGKKLERKQWLDFEIRR